MNPSSSLREPVSGLTHLASAVAAAVGAVFLALGACGSPVRLAVFLVYGVSMVALFSASAAYHLAVTSPARQLLLRRMDHSAIYVLIAGTYTPICVIALPGTVGTLMLAAVWLLAAVGIVSKVFFFERIPRWVSTVLYVLMGWIALAAIVPLARNLPPRGLFWLFGGGFLYTVGAVFYSMKKLVIVPGVLGFHEIFHVFVSAGAAAHFVLIYVWLPR